MKGERGRWVAEEENHTVGMRSSQGAGTGHTDDRSRVVPLLREPVQWRAYEGQLPAGGNGLGEGSGANGVRVYGRSIGAPQHSRLAYQERDRHRRYS